MAITKNTSYSKKPLHSSHHRVGRGGLGIRSRLRGGRAPGSKPDSTEEPSCCGPVACQIIRKGPNVLPLVCCGSLERGCQFSYHPRHRIAVQNYDVRPKIALVLL
ncbi:hypothetical protein AVEN_50876-1 [Araneus ventricosus]|uniref:Uncharacterized protein n=1 Tax=Araneus ventricosus TaxID=182803 RepID=A0A4Y2MAS7_ARAVE|nr:hypothetical protein AVEN_50876-1 [Araneus ventricosus]